MSPRVRPLEDRFSQFVSPEPNSGCWLWDGASAKGYGLMSIDGRNVYATHVALRLAGRLRPSRSMIACHHCDVSFCVNAEHLYWGTSKTNSDDTWRRGRHPGTPVLRGEQQWSATLTDAQVREIASSREPRRILAARFNVSLPALDNILYGDAWRHITGGKRLHGYSRGERHFAAKLTIEQVRHIRASDARAVELAQRFGVSASLIYAVRAGTVWKDA